MIHASQLIVHLTILYPTVVQPIIVHPTIAHPKLICHPERSEGPAFVDRPNANC